MRQESSRHLVDPQLYELLGILPTIELNEGLLPILREAKRLPFPPVDEATRLVELSTVEIPGPKDAPKVRVLVYRPPLEGALPCIIHIHGGGFVMGAAAPYEPMHRRMALELGCVIVAVDYRLAPETPFPGSIEDCYATLDWTFASAKALGVDVARIGVMGESAGGGLAAALALLVRDRGEYHLAFQHLIYPMLDDRTCVHPDPHAYVGEFVWTPHNNHFGWSALLGVPPGSSDVSPYAAAARAQDLSGLPPAFLSVGSLDLFLEEGVEYARRLLRSGVPTELHVFPGGFHGYDIDQTAEISRAAQGVGMASLRRFLRNGQSWRDLAGGAIHR